MNNLKKELMSNLKIRKNRQFTVKNEKLYFINISNNYGIDYVSKIKSSLTRFELLYKFVKYILSPIHFNNKIKTIIQSQNDKTIINIGSGNIRLGENVINIDTFDYKNVDIVCDVHDLPFENESIDIVINESLLEHVTHPEKVIDEIHRILRKGGLVLTDMPFICGFHAAPHDYSRRTRTGLLELFKDFHIEECEVSAGPTSALLWILQEYVAILMSFGNKKAHFVIWVVMMLITFPFKYLDAFLSKYPMSENIAATFYLIGKK